MEGVQAANMKKLTWDPDLAACAQEWTNKCNFAHSPDDFRNGAGENMCWKGWYGAPNLNEIGKQFVDKWACERHNLIDETALFPFNFWAETNNVCYGGAIGHWSQIIWADTDKVIKKIWKYILESRNLLRSK